VDKKIFIHGYHGASHRKLKEQNAQRFWSVAAPPKGESNGAVPICRRFRKAGADWNDIIAFALWRGSRTPKKGAAFLSLIRPL
jgi:hypothetical protein